MFGVAVCVQMALDVSSDHVTGGIQVRAGDTGEGRPKVFSHSVMASYTKQIDVSNIRNCNTGWLVTQHVAILRKTRAYQRKTTWKWI